MAAGLRRHGVNPTTMLPQKQDDVIVFDLYLLCLSVLLRWLVSQLYVLLNKTALDM